MPRMMPSLAQMCVTTLETHIDQRECPGFGQALCSARRDGSRFGQSVPLPLLDRAQGLTVAGILPILGT
jgi:hypothetical protein